MENIIKIKSEFFENIKKKILEKTTGKIAKGKR